MQENATTTSFTRENDCAICGTACDHDDVPDSDSLCLCGGCHNQYRRALAEDR